MAQRFIQQATSQLAPSFQKQATAIRQQIPAIQKQFDALTQGLERQRGVETQKLLEDASRRGVLRSSLATDALQDLGGRLLEARGALDVQRQQQIGGIQTSLADLGVQQQSAITNLAAALQNLDLQKQSAAAQRAQGSAINKLIESMNAKQEAADAAAAGEDVDPGKLERLEGASRAITIDEKRHLSRIANTGGATLALAMQKLRNDMASPSESISNRASVMLALLQSMGGDVNRSPLVNEGISMSPITSPGSQITSGVNNGQPFIRETFNF